MGETTAVNEAGVAREWVEVEDVQERERLGTEVTGEMEILGVEEEVPDSERVTGVQSLRALKSCVVS